MCGRYTLSSPADAIAEHFGLEHVPELGARYNIAPTQESLIVQRAPLPAQSGLRAEVARWGFRSRPGSAGRLLINARSETVGDLPAFAESYLERRCLVPATGFYEWVTLGRTKQPYYFFSRDSALVAFAGLWRTAPEGDSEYTILTTRANAVVDTVHERMPVILRPARYSVWLGPEPLSAADSEQIFRPWPADLTAKNPVGMRVNDPSFDESSCIDPLEGPVDLFLY